MPTTYNNSSTTYNQSSLSYTGDAGSLANLPAIAVYVAFDTVSPYDVLPVWTEITTYVRDMSIRRGRTDDLQRFAPAEATLVLDNNQRLFDPLNSASIYSGKLTARKQIKVEAIWDSTTYVVFRGFVSAWPIEWTDAGKDSTVTIDCFDLIGLLATEQLPKDWPFWFTTKEKLLTSDDHYWRFNEGQGAAAIKDWVGGMNLTSYMGGFAGPKLGEPCVSESLFFPSISGEKFGVTAAKTNSFFGWQGFGWCVNAKGVSGLPNYTFRIRRGYQELRVQVNSDGSISGSYRDNNVANGFTFSAPAGTALYDQPMYWYGIATNNLTWFFFQSLSVDAPVTTSASAISNSTFSDLFEATNCFLQECYTSDADLTPYYRAQGVVAREVGDYVEPRLERFIDTTRISRNWTDIDDEYEALPPSGSRVWSDRLISLTDFSSNPEPITEIDRVIDASQGVFFCTKEGILTYLGREYAFERPRNITSQITFTDSGVGIGYDKSSLRVRIDGDLIRNNITMRYAGSGEYTGTNQDSLAKYGAADMTLDTDLSYGPTLSPLQNYTTAESQVDFLLSIYKEPKIKIEPFIVRGQQNPSYNWPLLLNLEVLDRVTFVRTPTVGSAINREMLVQSIEHRITPALWETKINGSTRFTNWFIIGKSLIGGEDLLY